MLTLYGCYRSRATRPLWFLKETELPFVHVPVVQSYRLDAPHGPEAPLNTASPAFLAVNPLGQIPVLTDGALVLTESLAITLHLARSQGGSLGPADAAELALMEQWALFAATALEGPGLEIQMIQDAGGDASAEGQAAIALMAEKLRRPMARVEAHLVGQGGWLVGERFTAAEVNTVEVLRYAQRHPTLFGEFPAVQDWMVRCQSRPAYQEMWATRMAEAL